MTSSSSTVPEGFTISSPIKPAVDQTTPKTASTSPTYVRTGEKRCWSAKRMMEEANKKRKEMDFHLSQLGVLITSNAQELVDIAEENVEFGKEVTHALYLALFEWIRVAGLPTFDVSGRVTHQDRMRFVATFSLYLAETDSVLLEKGYLAAMSIVRACDQWIDNHRVKLEALEMAGKSEQRTLFEVRKQKKSHSSAGFEESDV
jgi:hypothetical protein